MKKDIQPGDSVKIRGYRSNINARYNAVGKVRSVDNELQTAVVDAGVYTLGLVTLNSVDFSQLTVIERNKGSEDK